MALNVQGNIGQKYLNFTTRLQNKNAEKYNKRVELLLWQRIASGTKDKGCQVLGSLSLPLRTITWSARISSKDWLTSVQTVWNLCGKGAWYVSPTYVCSLPIMRLLLIKQFKRSFHIGKCYCFYWYKKVLTAFHTVKGRPIYVMAHFWQFSSPSDVQGPCTCSMSNETGGTLHGAR